MEMPEMRNDSLYYSTNWDDRDRVAYQSHTNTAYVDSCISIDIGTKTFNLT